MPPPVSTVKKLNLFVWGGGWEKVAYAADNPGAAWLGNAKSMQHWHERRGMNAMGVGPTGLNYMGAWSQYNGDTSVPTAAQDPQGHYGWIPAAINSRVVEQGKTLGVRLYAGTSCCNYRYQTEPGWPGQSEGPPYEMWHDDNAWNRLLADLDKMLSSCKAVGIVDGFQHDFEGYGYANKDGTMWSWAYPGKPAGMTQDQSRELIKHRGQQFAAVQAKWMPNSIIGVYHQRITGSYQEWYQWKLINPTNTNGLFRRDQFDGAVYDSFIAGMASVPGIRAVRFRQSEFYKFPPLLAHKEAYDMDRAGIRNRMSQLFTAAEHDAAMARLQFGGMIWPTNGNSGSEIGNELSVDQFRVAMTAAVDNADEEQSIWCFNMDDDPFGGTGNDVRARRDHTMYEPVFAELMARGR